MFLIRIINENTGEGVGEEIGIVLRAVTKAAKESSQISFVDIFLTFCGDGWFRNTLRWLRL